jgi:hypothetical protein
MFQRHKENLNYNSTHLALKVLIPLMLKNNKYVVKTNLKRSLQLVTVDTLKETYYKAMFSCKV